MLEGFINEFLATLIEGFLNLIDFSNLLDLAFFTENEFGNVSGIKLDKLILFFQDAGILFISIKFLLRGFNTYILYTDGDADVSPFQLLTRFGKALVIAVSFRQLYSIIMNNFTDFIETSQQQVFSSFYQGFSVLKIITALSAFSAVNLILLAIWVIYAFMLWFSFIRRGIEMMILRSGFSWACAGIINSDDGVFRPYLNKFVQNAITVLIQYLLTSLSLRFIVTDHYLFAIFTLATAHSTPKFLQEFIIASRGDGGMMNKAYYAGQMARTAYSSASNVASKMITFIKR